MRSSIVLLSSLLFVACSIRGAEPIYEGKPESYWIATVTNLAAAEAISKLGDDGIIVLIKAAVHANEPGAAGIRESAFNAPFMQVDADQVKDLFQSRPDSNLEAAFVSVLCDTLQ